MAPPGPRPLVVVVAAAVAAALQAPDIMGITKHFGSGPSKDLATVAA